MSDTMLNRTMRLRIAVRHPLTECRPPVLLNRLLSVFESAGIPLAVVKDKRPKPIAELAYPLPLGIEGLEEWADVTLANGIAESLNSLKEQLIPFLPKGMEILGIEQIPNHSSSVAELCKTAYWQWFCPDEYISLAKQKIAEFIGSESFQINKSGKVEGRKCTKSIEIRHLMQELMWGENVLSFSTPITKGQATNPQKIIAAILGVDVECLGKIIRQSVTLKQDPKLDRHDKYAQKLRNIYEDAILLETSPNFKVYDDDDDILSL
ncbi:MAG: DUF2344 domain-containing protein [Holophagaceae bacterium]|nr:DUF2344 domain-containing protein [Holophagaceae bacterium]